MASSILPLSRLDPADVVEYLGARGLSEEIVRWKYFDASMNPRGRERGLGWVKDDRLSGFIGLLPAQLGRGDRSWEMCWTCDWSLAERTAAPGIGVRLLKTAMEENDHLMYLTRGSEYTAGIAPRAAQQTVDDAVAMYTLPLRLGAFMYGLRHRMSWLDPSHWPRLARIPLRPTPRAAAGLLLEEGVSRRIEPLLESPRGPGWFPRYDWAYVDWVVGRCPVLESRTVSAVDGRGARAAALIWRRRESPQVWRMTLMAQPGADDALRRVVAGALRAARDGGGILVSILLSRQDAPLIAVLKRGHGAIERPRQPLFLFSARDPEVDEVANLSFLDADLAYQF